MAVKIRLSRLGRKHLPVYRIVVVDSRTKRDSKYLDNIGSYDPIKGKILQFNEKLMMDWMGKGAIVTDSVKKIYKLYKKGQGTKTTVKAAPKKVVEKAEVKEEATAK